MNKHLNNWLDKAEGREHNSSNKAIEKEKMRQGVAKKMKSKKRESNKEYYDRKFPYMKVHEN